MNPEPILELDIPKTSSISISARLDCSMGKLEVRREPGQNELFSPYFRISHLAENTFWCKELAARSVFFWPVWRTPTL